METERGEIVVATVDSFRAFADDPYLVGRVAAVNAVSDLWAKGVAPRFALAQVSVPETEPARAEETLYQVMAGARAALEADGVTLVGGHTTTGPELVVGFAVWGFAASADALIRDRRRGAPGDQLILTKPLGTGVILQADMRGLARGEWVEAAAASMLRSNARPPRAMLALRPSAATDVTGFGLAGHLGEMLRASKGSAVLDLAAIPALPGAVALLGRGIRSTAHPENARARRAMLVEPDAARTGDARPALRSPDLGRAAARGAAGARPGDAERASRGGRRGGRDHRRGRAAPARRRADPGGHDGLALDALRRRAAGAISTTRPAPQPYLASDRSRTAATSSRSDRASTTRARPRNERRPTRARTAGSARRFCTQCAFKPCSATR